MPRPTQPGRPVSGARARIERWSEQDLALLQRLVGAPEMMRHLGGPESSEQIAARHARYLVAESMFKIVEVGSGEPAGWVGYWERRWNREDVYEIGWAVVPELQGRGLAGEAASLAVLAAAFQPPCRFMHAFPSVHNEPSNAICRKVGFGLVGACEVEYPPGTFMRCNDWRLDLLA